MEGGRIIIIIIYQTGNFRYFHVYRIRPLNIEKNLLAIGPKLFNPVLAGTWIYSCINFRDRHDGYWIDLTSGPVKQDSGSFSKVDITLKFPKQLGDVKMTIARYQS